MLKPVVIENALSKEHCNFLYEYQTIKYLRTKYFYENGLFADQPFLGTLEDEPECKGSFVLFGDPAFDLVMMRQLESVEKYSGHELLPMVSNCRMYLKGNVIMSSRGTGRTEENITAAVHLGHDGSDKLYPFFVGLKTGESFQANLNVGDMIVYDGSITSNWREPCEHDYYGQVMLQYIKKGSVNHKVLDGRTHLGMPGGDYFNRHKKIS